MYMVMDTEGVKMLFLSVIHFIIINVLEIWGGVINPCHTFLISDVLQYYKDL